ncbi:MAG TPA: type I 3-dehydroquinate dehydratase [Thermoanaerobaculia bacterium]|jgi:3-dehydroquinate dehydratase/shikimate dehydrogenase|nr:type I 3-dehydroquinate dehydratase [Thermoanaerobaculia bacterium]
MTDATLIVTLTAPPNGELSSLPAAVRALEVRADLLGDVDPDGLRQRFAGELIYSLRSRAEGGAFEGSPEERRRRLAGAARRFDMVELGADDLEPEVLAAVPPGRRLVSWHGPSPGLEGLRERWARLSSVEARLYRLAPEASRPEEALAPLRFLSGLGKRRDVLAFATGPAGTWTRVLAPRLGAPVACGGLTGNGSGDPTVAQLVADYGLPALAPIRELFGIVGRTAGRSLSPRLHNAAYRALGVEALYLPFPVEGFAGFWQEVVTGLDGLGWPLRGLTVTSPHKEAALALAGEASPLARQSGGANTLLRHDGCWRADTADADGVVKALERRRVPLAGMKAAVVGCGGAGRAAAAGLQRAGADVTLVNRGAERGAYAARLLGLPFIPLSELRARDFPLVVHATPLTAESPFPVEDLREGGVVVELVYGPAPTPLMTAARARGSVAIDGREVLLVEARRQFRMMTGRSMPAGPARALIGSPGERPC